eukprot:sb/3477457/
MVSSNLYILDTLVMTAKRLLTNQPISLPWCPQMDVSRTITSQQISLPSGRPIHTKPFLHMTSKRENWFNFLDVFVGRSCFQGGELGANVPDVDLAFFGPGCHVGLGVC